MEETVYPTLRRWHVRRRYRHNVDAEWETDGRYDTGIMHFAGFTTAVCVVTDIISRQHAETWIRNGHEWSSRNVILEIVEVV